MKKIEIVERWLHQNMGLLRCPVCQSSFKSLDQHQLQCVNNHRININKHGYVYFLNRGVKSEYSQDMLEARRAILNAGLFNGILDRINQLMPDQPQKILDVGTGEGTPLARLQKIRECKEDTYIGFDISRAGVQLATQLNPDLFFCLADLRQLPFADDSMDTIIELFSPSDYHEFNRVLKPGGQIFKVIPGSSYLQEMRELLYPADDRHQHYDNSAVEQLFLKHYQNAKVINIHYLFEIPESLRSSMILMSPLHWGKNVRELDSNEVQQLKSVTVDVDLLVGNLK
ncbi:MAG TPA: methyltransferase domain-containing protein [Candidatus Limosilactobacillus intestinavium]|nr:methyltransferase domain-containing protein [Candidatus Limosilactobacillus intestinavium]